MVASSKQMLMDLSHGFSLLIIFQTKQINEE